MSETINKVAQAIKNQARIHERGKAFQEGLYLGTITGGLLSLDGFPYPVEFIQIRTSNRLKVEGGQIGTLWHEAQYDVKQDEFQIDTEVELQLKDGDRVLAGAIKNGTEFIIIGLVK